MKKRGNIPHHEPNSKYSGLKLPAVEDWSMVQEMPRADRPPELDGERLSQGATIFPADHPELADSPDQMF